MQHPLRRLITLLPGGGSLILISLVVLLSVAAYAQPEEKPPEGIVKSVEAVVHAPEYMGACWLLTTEYGRLEPTNLAPEFRIDGLKVVISFSKRHDLASTCMMGWIVTLSSIVHEAS